MAACAAPDSLAKHVTPKSPANLARHNCLTYAVYPSRQFLTPEVRSGIDFLVERFGPNPHWDQGID